MRMTPRQQQAFDAAQLLSHQAAACGLYGHHAEAAHLWLMAASCAVTEGGKVACLENALDEWRHVPASREAAV
jgi:hypothetical protein